MREFIILLILLVFHQFGICQDLTHVTIQNDKGNPVPYVTVSVKDESNGIIADLDGRFVLNTFKDSDTLLFSCLGYDKKYLTYYQIIDNQNKVVVTEKVYDLQEVEINYKKIKLGKKFAVANGTKSDNKNSPMYLGLNTAIKIKGNNDLQKIVQIRFYTNEVCKENSFMRIRIVSCDSTNKPSKDLLINDAITVSVKQKSWNNVNISNKSVFTSGDFFVVFESLNSEIDCFIIGKSKRFLNSYNISLACANEIAEGYASRFGGEWIKSSIQYKKMLKGNTIILNKDEPFNFVPYVEVTMHEVKNNNR